MCPGAEDANDAGPRADLETIEKIADYVEQRYEADAPPAPDGLVIPPAFSYLRFKAFGFLLLGPEVYRRIDAFGYPTPDMDTDQDRLRHGCAQIVEWRGLSLDRPLEGIGIRGFNSLLLMCHFRCQEQSAHAVAGRPNTFLDTMRMVHLVETREITLYNLVDHSKPAPVPCPYCGELLRTATAKQCRTCGMDWHDPANVICRKKP